MEVMYTRCTTVDSSWVEGLQAYVYRGGSGSEMAGALQFTNVLQGKYSIMRSSWVGGVLIFACDVFFIQLWSLKNSRQK